MELEGPRTRQPPQPFPTTLRLQLPYARAWDAVVAVLASRGFPLEVVARDSGIVGTGWKITQPNHQVRIGRKDFLGRKAERLTVLVRPLANGSQISITGQSALVSPQWSAAGMPPAGQAVDIPTDTVTEYGLLYDVAGVLGLALRRAPDSAYGVGLSSTGVFEPPPASPAPASTPATPEPPPTGSVRLETPTVRTSPPPPAGGLVGTGAGP
ncbi:MAG: hypothetical protein P1V51_24390 [Deltaproteobacteria bacterium]|nr:hypothetical protein [Deltaproteobacteria bacterium]